MQRNENNKTQTSSPKNSPALKESLNRDKNTVIAAGPSFPRQWNSLNAIQTKWIMLERDKNGYLIYEPCDGGTPRIEIDGGYVTVYWQLDAPGKYSIEKFTRLTGNKAFYMNAFDGKNTMEFIAQIKDADRKLVLWTFGGTKWIMTPAEYAGEFRHVTNPCPN